MNILKENKRLFYGVLIVLILFLSIAISSWIEKFINLDSMINVDNKFSKVLPENFVNELFNPKKISGYDVKVAENDKVVGFLISQNASQAFVTVKEEMELNSWKCVPSGSDIVASFYKDEGKYRWAFLNCTDLGGDTSVVLTVN